MKAGTTDHISYFKLVDPVTGIAETGLTVTDLELTYVRDQAAAVKADALAHGAVTDAHTDLECIEMDATKCPGLYRIDWPDAAFAVGVEKVQLCVTGAAIDPAVQEIELTVGVPPLSYHPDVSSAITVGNQDAGTFASCGADDGARWTIGDEDGSPTIDVTCEFNMGAGRTATGLTVNGYFNRFEGGGYVVEVYAHNYTTGADVKLSAGTPTTELRDRSNDKDYTFALGPEYTDPAGTPGEVKIRFKSTRDTTAVGDVLYLDHVQINGIGAGGLTSTEIAVAVHTELDAHLQHDPGFTGSVRYVDGTNGSDENGGHIPTDAFATISAAAAASSAGDYLKVLAGSYAEAVTLAVDGLELHGEIGVEITGNGGIALTVSANHCKVDWIDLTPAAGQTGCLIGGDENHFEYCQSHDSGAIGFRLNTTAERNHFIHCYAAQFTGTGFDVRGFGNVFTECVATGNGGTEKGFHLSDTAAHRNVFDRCDTVDCATAGWSVDAGADDNLFVSCADSAGCGARVDSGTNNTWRDFMETDDTIAAVFAYAGILADGTTTFAVITRDLYARHVLTSSRVGDLYTFQDSDGTALYTGTLAAPSWTKGSP